MPPVFLVVKDKGKRLQFTHVSVPYSNAGNRLKRHVAIRKLVIIRQLAHKGLCPFTPVLYHAIDQALEFLSCFAERI